jgi:hypothetical protein
MKKLRLALLAVLSLLVAVPVIAILAAPKPEKPISIPTSFGGNAEEFLIGFEAMRDSGRPVRISGVFCISACTLVFSTVPKGQLCAEPWTRFGFHTAKVGSSYNKEASEQLFDTYPPVLQVKLRALGLNPSEPHDELVIIKATDMMDVVNICKE